MRTFSLRIGVLIVAITATFATARAEVTDSQIRKSIDKAVRYLKDQQKPDGSWEDQQGYAYGVTSLVLLAMLNAEYPLNDPQMTKALEYLRAKKPDKTYAVALQTLVFCKTKQDADKKLVERNVKGLQDSQIRDGEESGGWSYMGNGDKKFGNEGDNSNTQFAIWALHEADRAGVKTDPEMWKLAHKYWEKGQASDGSWGYHANAVSSGSMTCAGIASLQVSILHSTRKEDGDKKVQEDKKNEQRPQELPQSIEKGLEWLGKNFSIKSNPIGGRAAAMLDNVPIWRMYYLNDLARVGQLTGREKIGDHKWYREGAELLVKEQDVVGGWWLTRESPSVLEDKNVSTCFALLFLTADKVAHPGSSTDSSSSNK